jgi:hypothetical protein
VEWLSEILRLTGFGDREKNRITRIFAKADEIAGKRAPRYSDREKETGSIDQAKVQASKSMISNVDAWNTCKQCTGQLRAQGAIFNKEIDLGNNIYRP